MLCSSQAKAFRKALAIERQAVAEIDGVLSLLDPPGDEM